MKKIRTCYSGYGDGVVSSFEGGVTPNDGARSASKSPSTSVGDYQTNDLDRPATSLNGLGAWSCKPSLHETEDHAAIEPMHERKLVLCHAVQNAVKQRQCMSLLLA
jgi:hypothetical protein